METLFGSWSQTPGRIDPHSEGRISEPLYCLRNVRFSKVAQNTSVLLLPLSFTMIALPAGSKLPSYWDASVTGVF
jgi:hypothetical protein